MKKEREMLKRIVALPEPRHLFVLPDWADPATLDFLLKEGYLTCLHFQRDDNKTIHLVMGLQLTPKGEHLIHPKVDWTQIAWALYSHLKSAGSAKHTGQSDCDGPKRQQNLYCWRSGSL